MKIKQLKKVMYIEDDLNTRINNEMQSLSYYKNEDEIITLIHIQNNGVVTIETKSK